MNNWNVRGRWNEMKGKLKQRYAQVANDNFSFQEGEKDELIGKLQQRLGKKRDALEKILSDKI